MVRAAFSAILCLLGVSGSDEASLLQANAGKKRIQAHSTAKWVEEFAKSPGDVMSRVLDMQPAEQTSLLELFAAADSSNLAKELEPHKELLALVMRGSPLHSLAKGPTSKMVSALQQRNGVLEEVISTKKDQIRKKNDGKNSSSFPADIDIKNEIFELSGGRCRDGREFEDVDFDTACQMACDGAGDCTVGVVEQAGFDANSTEPDVCKFGGAAYDHFATGTGLSDEETCADLCAINAGWCTDSAFEDGVCKRFKWNMKSFKKKTLRGCAKRCELYTDCMAFEWDNGECELHDNETTAELSSAEELGDEHACYIRNTA